MMKRIIAWLFIFITIGTFCSCGADGKNDLNSENSSYSAKISPEDALKNASEYWGIKQGDRDPDTGYLFNIVITGMPTADHPVYTVSLKWMVDGHRYSTVDGITVDAQTGECSIING